MKINEYPIATSLLPADKLLTDGVNGTKTVPASEAFFLMMQSLGQAQNHRAFPRGKYLGNTFSTAQAAAIANGSFNELWVGDFWTINGVNYRIVDVNYHRNVSVPHLVIMPDAPLYKAAWDTSTGRTTGGYWNANLVKNGLTTAETMIKSAFGPTRVLQYEGFFPLSADATGRPNNLELRSIYLEIPCEFQIFGARVVGAEGTTKWVNQERGAMQLALFSHWGLYGVANDLDFWLRDTSTEYARALVRQGGATLDDSITMHGVRPLFLVG